MNSQNCSYHALQTFKSKKNQVTLVRPVTDGVEDADKLYVLKRYRSDHTEELRWLLFLHKQNLRVPEVLAAEAGEILMQYLPGETLCDYLARQEELGSAVAQLAPVLQALFSWLSDFYRVARTEECWILGDVNLRNFILGSDGQIYGIDFEDCCAGKVEEDAGKICAFALTYVPAFTTWKEELTRALFAGLVQELCLDAECVQLAFQQELQAIGKRRRLPLNSFTNFDLRAI